MVSRAAAGFFFFSKLLNKTDILNLQQQTSLTSLIQEKEESNQIFVQNGDGFNFKNIVVRGKILFEKLAKVKDLWRTLPFSWTIFWRTLPLFCRISVQKIAGFPY